MLNDVIQLKSLLGLVFKLGGIFVSILYVFFALVVIRQIDNMKKVIEIKDNGLLLLISYILLIATVILLLYSLLFL